jgi:uncharacterized protein
VRWVDTIRSDTLDRRPIHKERNCSMTNALLRRVLSLGLLFLAAVPAAAVAPSQDKDLSPAVLESTRQFDFTSSFTGEEYRVQIFVPRQPPPQQGYAVLYVLDGNVLFGTYAGAARTRALAREIAPTVVVGIASGEGPDGADRDYDFSMSGRSPRDKAIVKEWDPDQRTGGAEAFFKAVQQEIRPRVAAIVKTDPARSTLLGWSLGGLFVTHVMFEHPEAFATFVALSPSLWYNERFVFREIPDFRKHLAREHVRPRFYLAAGSREDRIPSFRFGSGVDPRQLADETRYYNMVGNPRALKAILSHPQNPPVQLRFRVLEGETHNSIPWATINSVMDFASPL